MRYSKYAILLLLLLGFITGFSQTVVVTSTADAGAGTLREALMRVPAIRTTPYIINFNLSGTPANDADRTIRLESQLPAIPSNVIIDGSSQNWPKLGISGAKVILEPANPNVYFNCLTIGDFSYDGKHVNDVEIYGLYIKDFAKITNLQTVNASQGSGIVIDSRANNIKIGAPGKGNVIGGNINGILIQNSYYYNTPTPLTEISIRANLIGVTYDGSTAKTNVTGISANLYDCSLSVGGDNANEGNVIAANQINVNIVRNGYSTNNRFNINVIGNKIGTNHNGTADYRDLQLFNTSGSIEISGLKVNAINTNLYVRNNTISGNRSVGVSIASSDFVLAGNTIGTGVLGTELFGNGTGVKIEEGAVGKVGGDTPADANRIAYNNNGIESVSSRPVTITRNSMYCNKAVSINKTQAIAQPFVQILVIRPNFLSGKATPNSAVELFYTNHCEGKCEGKTYFATVTAQGDGKWTYSGAITGKVTATASLLNLTTSPFSIPEVFDSEVILKNVTCVGTGGSINVPEPREGITFTWNKVILNTGTRQFLSNAQKIENLEEGTYELITDDGCTKVQRLPLFEIKDQKLKNLEVKWPRPSCGQLTFPFSATVDRGEGNLTYEWTDVITNQVIFIGKNAMLPEGTYKLKVTDESGCFLESVAKKIDRLPSPIINTGTASVRPAACGATNGEITNITLTDVIGEVKYKWYVMNRDDFNGNYVQGKLVGEEADLMGMPGGTYMLEVKDQGPCPAVRIPYPGLTIGITNSVRIHGGSTQPVTCSNNNGAINGIYIEQGDTYTLTTSAGVLVKSGTCTSNVPFNITTGVNGGLAAGTYILNASNSITLCTADAAYYTIGITPVTEYTIQTPDILKAACGMNNGSIKLTYTGLKRPAEEKCVWRNKAGTIIPGGTSTELSGLDEGDYTLHITDENGCTSPPLGPFSVRRIELLIVDQTSGRATDDQCGLGRGTVTGVRITGCEPLSGSGEDAVYKYTWRDINGTIVGTKKDLTDKGAGEYYLEVADQNESRCGTYRSRTFKIEAPIIPLQIPTFDQKRRVCYATEIMIPIAAPEEGVYQLFHSKDDVIPIMETKNGILIFKVAKTGDYVIRRKNGTCVSDFAPLHIEVTNDNLEIKNTMTPNGDGMNDNWVIRGLPEHKDINIKVFTRSGQLVYESVGPYNKPFDGRFRGVELPAGAYYYKIDLRADCDPIGGSITLLR